MLRRRLPRSSWVVGRSFNSLFEMLNAVVALVERNIQTTFNSLFEMR